MKNDTKCARCRYSSTLSGVLGDKELGCIYILKTGEARGEPAGDNCSKFKPKRRRMRNGFPDFTRRNNDQVNQ